jgi:hypothetical protein
MSLAAIGDGNHDHDTADGAVRDEILRAIHDPALSLTHGRRSHAGRITPCPSFRQSPGA